MKNDILTIDDVTLEIRVGILIMRRRKERKELARRTTGANNRRAQRVRVDLPGYIPLGER